ncbi:hypothetical protein T492DRAFT_868283 [Pavlovales sp. CCMP2436]|nr:hypothetical protein T492DRAFT_868283 [Pavlovales sp. CCMP2436]
MICWLLFVVFPSWAAIGASALKRASSSCAWPRAAIVPIVSMSCFLMRAAASIGLTPISASNEAELHQLHARILHSLQTTRRELHAGCTGCNYSATLAGNFKEHKRTHSGERPYACDAPGCNYSVTQAGTLKRHKCTHSG